MTNIAKTINIYLIAEMHRPDLTKSFDYMIYLENRSIKIIPTGIETQFTDVYLSPEFVTADNEEEFIRIFGINLTANIELHGTENDDYHVIVDDLGQIVITLDINSEDTNSYGDFIEVVENNQIDLVVEDLSEEEVEDKIDNSEEPNVEIDEPDTSSISAEVLIESELSDEEGPQWIVTYDLDTTNESLTEAEEDEINKTDIITAPDIESAAKYAEQNARIKARENPRWKSAEVISIEKRSLPN